MKDSLMVKVLAKMERRVKFIGYGTSILSNELIVKNWVDFNTALTLEGKRRYASGKLLQAILLRVLYRPGREDSHVKEDLPIIPIISERSVGFAVWWSLTQLTWQRKFNETSL